MTSREAACVFFILILLVGIAIAKDYGISWDEKAMYVLGEQAYGYILNGTPYPTHVGIRFHGAWFEILQYAVQELFVLRFARDIFIVRHMMNFLTFWVGLVSLYAIGLRTFRSRNWALFAALMLLLSPRQFGHAFFNGRDIPAMAFFTLKMFTLLLFLDRPTSRKAVLHGITSGLVIATRVGLLFLPLYTVLFLGFRIVLDMVNSQRVPWKRYGIYLAMYLITFAVATVAFWPLLWEQPIHHVVEALRNMLWEQSPAGGFYLGENVGELPWHWVPVHIVTKTPLLYIVLALTAVVHLFVAAVKRPSSLLIEHRDTFLFFLWFTIPIFTVIFLHATLFDEWRHLYFIYSALILLAATALRALLNMLRTLHTTSGKALRIGLIACCVLSFSGTALWMVQNHPLQYVYFSLPSRWIEGEFELDYWGLSFRQGYEWVLENDSDDLISVSVTSSPGWENLNILTRDQRRRLIVRRQFDTKYILDNFRWQKYEHGIPDEFKVHSVWVSGMEVLGIYRNPNWNPQKDREQPRMEDFEVQLRFGKKDKQLWKP